MTRSSALQMPHRCADPEPVAPEASRDDRDTTLLAGLLHRGAPDAGAGLARRLMDRFGGLGDVLAADPGELCRVPGMTAETVAGLKRYRDLAVAVVRGEARARPALTSFQQLRDYAVAAQAHLPREEFRVLHLDHRNHLLDEESVASDPTVQAAVDRRIERLLDVTAARIVAGARRGPVAVDAALDPEGAGAHPSA